MRLMSLFAMMATLLLAPIAGAEGQLAVTIGGERGVGAELGAIRDVAVLPALIVILERSAPHIRIFDHAGRLRQTLGRAGAGPGEYGAPFSLAYDSTQDVLYVVDPANARLTEYSVSDTLVLGRSLATDVVNLRDVCFLRGRLFGISSSRTHLLDELALNGGRLTSQRQLGLPQTNHPLAAHQQLKGRASDGPLYCDAATGTIWVASRLLGEVHVVSAETGSQETVPIKGFHAIRLEAGGSGALTMSAPSDGFYEGLTSLVPSGSNVGVVIGRYDKKDEITAYQLIELSAKGDQGPRITQLWQQVGVLKQGVVCAVSNPYPTVALFPGERCP